MARVLVVDNELGFREHLKRLFSADGYDVETAASGAEAIESAGRFDPDVLVTDWILKDHLDGLDVSRSLRELNPRLATILITGYPSPELKTEAKAAHVAAFFKKPFDPEKLQDAVRRAIEEQSP